MAVEFNQNLGISHTCLQLPFNAVGNCPYTFVCWIYRTAGVDPADELVLNISNSPSIPNDSGYHLQLHEDSPTTYKVRGLVRTAFFGSASQLCDSEAVPINEWVHAAVVFDGSGVFPTSISVYINGVLSNSEPVTLRIWPSLDSITIGGFKPTSTTSQALRFSCLEQAAIYERVLSPSEIATLAANTPASSVQPDDRLIDAFLEDEATAEDNDVGDPFTLSDDTPDGFIATCGSSPPESETPPEPEVDECGAEDEADELADAFTLPKCDLTPASINVGVISQTLSPGRSFTSREQLVHPDAGFWRIKYLGIPIRSRADALRWRENESRANGRNNPILVSVYEAPLSGTQIVAEAAGTVNIGDTAITIIQSAGADIRAGMHFSDGTRLYRLVTVSDPDVNDVVTARIFPPARAVITATAALDFNDPVCRCRLATDGEMDISLSLLRFGTVDVEFLEDV